MKALIDTNVLLDVAQQRMPHLADSDRVMKWCEANPGHGFIAWHSISNVYYVLRKAIDDASARQFITTLLDLCDVVETGTASAKLALHLSFTDFEDALQTAAAVTAGVDVIITRDKRDYAKSPIPVQSPDEFVATLPP